MKRCTREACLYTADGLHGRRRPFAALLMLLAVIALVGCSSAGSDELAPQTGLPTQTVEIAGQVFELELALDDASRHRGLSDREYIAEDGGMLFVFPEPRRLTFVMRDCLVPIDLVYLDGLGRIVRTHAMQVEPYGRADWLLTPYHSGEPAQFAVELRGGMIEELGLRRGQRIELPVEELKARAE
ncbi:DUF192 domain-containing protein [Phycisphaerales bacterium AB-hyl4]|uniref:DUF192 domain-containing protein n=1 Tax=Natronomicrosphaera hydrolytica TaxID=3242702 RepID=A0ABV4U5R2_9BACT